MRVILMLLLFTTPFLAISQNKVSQEIIGLEMSGAEFERAQLLTFETNDLNTRSSELEGLTEGTILKLDKAAIQNLKQNAPAFLQLEIPQSAESNLILDLVEHKIFTPDFQLKRSDGSPVNYTPGRHYKGMIKGNENSVVSISIYDDEMMGLISTKKGNLTLGKLAQSTTNEHILYNDRDMPIKQLDCATGDDGISYKAKDLKPVPMDRSVGDCIRVYVEIDNDIVVQKGGVTNATNYVTAVFAESITLYANENLTMVISEIKAWDTTSPYSSNSSSGMLNDYQNATGSFNGDLSHLVSYQASGGIAAGFSGICNSNPDNSKCFSSIDASFNNVPSYSFTVMVVTHEMGHLIGSRHTHACVWNGNNTAIDGCSGQTEGSCSLPGNPSSGGTIMSYCHITSAGIDFTQGFGPQPGNVIRNTIANSSCTSTCGPASCTDGIQNGDETGVDCGGSTCPACPTCTDGIQNGNETGVDCGGPDCAPCPCNGTNVTLTIVLDNYPEETSWTITSGGSTVASGGTYGSQPDGSTVTATACLADGCYDFTINDTYGDGICCSYGIGSYTLSDGSNTLASGGAFTSSETTNFCVGGGSGPTCSDGIQNQGETGVDCGGPNCDPCPPTCTDGIQNGDETGVDCGGSSCPACPPTCTDGIQNGDETGVDCGGSSCPDCPTGGGLIFGHFFETGLEGWQDGGSDCARVNSSRSYEGNYSVRLRDNSGTASSMTLNNVDVSGNSSADLEFYFYPNSMETGEDFWVQVNTGSGWTTVASYASGTSFSNNNFYVATVTIPITTNTIGLRFRCDASSNADRVYIDQVSLTGSGGGDALVELSSTIARVDKDAPVVHQSALGLTAPADDEVMVYPNPVSDQLTLNYAGDIQSIRVVSMTGKLMERAVISNSQKSIDVSNLPAGMYFVMIEKDGEMIPKKIMKM